MKNFFTKLLIFAFVLSMSLYAVPAMANPGPISYPSAFEHSAGVVIPADAQYNTNTDPDFYWRFDCPDGDEPDPYETVTVTFPSAFDLSSVNYTTVSLGTGDGSTFSYSGMPTVDSWYYSVDSGNRRITFTAPPNATTAPSNQRIDCGAAGYDDVWVYVEGLSADGDQSSTTSAAESAVILNGTWGVNGAALLYIGNSFENDVTINGYIETTLAFDIVDANHTPTNVCDLGLLTTSAVSTCDYYLKVTTNANSGYEVRVNSDGAFLSGANDIDAVGDGDTVNAGIEEYGFDVAANSITGGATGECNATAGSNSSHCPAQAGYNFASPDTPVPAEANNANAPMMYGTSGGNQPGSSGTTYLAQVTHKASVASGTATGNYSHIVTYWVTANF